MGKFVMPTFNKIMEQKPESDGKNEPVWVYLEREMLENLSQKPYNEKVGQWLRFLKELKAYFHAEDIRKAKRLEKEVGPRWYVELSSPQRQVLARMKRMIHQDLLEDVTRRMRKALSDLGITCKISKETLMKAMEESVEDPGVFFWNLYEAIYKAPPSDLLPKYDMNAMIMISCLVFVDMEECVETLNKATESKKIVSKERKKPKKKTPKPDGRYGEYLEKSTVPFYSSNKPKQEKKLPTPLSYKFKLRSAESLEGLVKSTSFLDKRKERNRKEKEVERPCTYKFWEPPSTLRNTDPKMAAYILKLRMLKLRPKHRFKTPYSNVQYLISGVSFTGGRPHYLLANVSLLPTGYIAINDGIAISNGEVVTCIEGFWKHPRDAYERCDSECDCLVKWESTVVDYLDESRCKCGHLYDMYNTGTRPKEKYFYPSTRHGSFWFDKAKIYQFDPVEDFIKETFEEAMRSNEATPEPSTPILNASGLKESELLSAFLADVAETTPLLIPHLPEANLLNNLQQWARNRVKGKLTETKHKRMILQSQRRWLELKHMDFRARAKQIPFTLKQIKSIKWSHRKLVQKMHDYQMNDFITRNRIKQLEQTRLWWSTCKYDYYPSKAFLDIFFTYMPGRTKDVHLINPFSAALIPKFGAKTCPLTL
ncbi:unnamed protein product [Spodoptera littoralis]|uniref:DUF4771 domain-containing protein n=1 Tax=Spodoptera littoralis TaxID=7109 RepID=A0A9P0N0Q4_SPOLI|nr:unnamed protein product [Spodoptera littoralis]CAH1638208.1 unnamed protein product [Spodoptera littoralis]